MGNETEQQMNRLTQERAQRLKRLKEAGWQHVDCVEENQRLYDQFVQARGFSIQSEQLIELPAKSLVYDFRHYECLSELNQQKIAACFRHAVFDFFTAHYAKATCVVLDVNHQSFRFKPGNLKLDESASPSPFTFRPPWEYVNVSDPDFTNGVLTEWKSTKLIVYGSDIVDAMLSNLCVLPSSVSKQSE